MLDREVEGLATASRLFIGQKAGKQAIDIMRATMEVVVWKLIWNVIERGN